MPTIPLTDRQALPKLLTSPDTFATTLVAVIVNEYGTECFTWDPETLRMEINDDFHCEIPSANFDRLMAGIGILTTDDFYKSLPDFINYCNILSGDSFDPSTFDPADTTEIAWGITEALLLDPPEEDDNPFSEEITAYIGAQLNSEGIINPPDILRIATRDNDPSMTVGMEYSDDPQTFAAIYGFEAEKTEDINTTINARLQALMTQLQQLPFNTTNITQAIATIGQEFAE